MPHPRVLRLRAEEKERLRLLFLAKHARSEGKPDGMDGSHAVYHHELLETLRSIGLTVDAADTFEDLPPRKDVDFVIPLLNRAGFHNSEMLAPLLLERAAKPYLGARPIIRGIADDKHIMKRLARAHGVETCDWAIYRMGEPVYAPPFADDGRMIVKPNASSASWGVAAVDDWNKAALQIEWLHAQGHEVIVEPWVPAMDVAVPVIGADGPWLLPPLLYPNGLRTYEEKRNLVESQGDPLVPLEDARAREAVASQTRALMQELWPFDYGRFEFRFDPTTGRVSFMEVNLSCNLWSKKTISRSAGLLQVDHGSLVETIVTHSLLRQGVISRRCVEQAA
jgi:D-alanine-D-alanine ligase